MKQQNKRVKYKKIETKNMNQIINIIKDNTTLNIACKNMKRHYVFLEQNQNSPDNSYLTKSDD